MKDAERPRSRDHASPRHADRHLQSGQAQRRGNVVTCWATRRPSPGRRGAAGRHRLVAFPQLAPVVRMKAIDTLLVDLYFWGGVIQAKKVAAICETFNLGLAVHSDRELGIGTAAGLHFWASTPTMSHFYDSHYHDQAGDVITEPIVFKDGGLRVPERPGLGVELESDRLAYHASFYQEHGDDIEFFDPKQRPGWTPHLPLW